MCVGALISWSILCVLTAVDLTGTILSSIVLVDWMHVPLGLAPGQKLTINFLDLPDYLSDESAKDTINNGMWC